MSKRGGGVGGGRPGQQSKITGFLRKADAKLTEVSPRKVEGDRPRSSLDNMTNRSEPVIASPEVKLKEEEFIDKTPEINPNKRRSKIRLRRTVVAGSEQREESKFKRKLEGEDEKLPSSPVFKKKKVESSLSTPIVENKVLTKVMTENKVLTEVKTENVSKASGERVTAAVETAVGAEDDNDELWGDFDESEVTPSEVKAAKVEEDEGDMWGDFEEEFEVEAEAAAEETPGSRVGRHRVVAVAPGEGGVQVELLSSHSPPLHRHLSLRHSWATTALQEGDTVHLEATWDAQGRAIIDDQQGLVVVHPDTLISSTTVVSALFCMRKAVLAEKFKGVEGPSRVMLLGTAVHELMQEVLRHQRFKRPEMLKLLDGILAAPRMMADLATIGMSEGDMRREVEPFLRHIQYFVDRFLLGRQVERPKAEVEEKKGQGREQWRGKVAEVRDIEESFWSPRLGMKGKIDLTVATVEASGARRLLPLEIKTGKPSYSTSHQGQVIIYCMMSKDRREQPAHGLLLYLGASSMAEVAAGRNEQRGLVQLRNELAGWLRGRGDGLPEPLSHRSACSGCGYLGICAIYQQAGATVPAAPHPMAELVPAALTHLAAEQVAWFHRWTGLLDLEGQVEGGGGPSTSDLWLLTPQQREERGQAAAGLLLERVVPEGHVFAREGGRLAKPVLAVGELVTVSTTRELAVAQGVVQREDGARLVVSLDRELTGRGPEFTVDRYAYQGGQGASYTGLGLLMADTPAARRLREAVVDLQEPAAAAGLGKEVAKHGRTVMRELNKVQQKAIFRCLMSRRYSLLRGMPGSGKTTTIVAMVRLMALLGQSVLVVAYTNSAVDTILTKLVAAGQAVLRLGRKERVRPGLWGATAEEVGRGAASPEELRERYSAHMVVGATCLGTAHLATAGRTFDWCVLDEASQALLPATLAPLLLAERFVLVGDPAQLPPTVRSAAARQGGLADSLFAVLDAAHPAAALELHLQYRMNARITALANHLTYEGRLECGSKEVEERLVEVKEETGGWVGACVGGGMEGAVVWADTRGAAEERREAGGVSNPGEAALVGRLVAGLLAAGVAEQEVGVIAPYSDQVKLLKVNMQCWDRGGLSRGKI